MKKEKEMWNLRRMAIIVFWRLKIEKKLNNFQIKKNDNTKHQNKLRKIAKIEQKQANTHTNTYNKTQNKLRVGQVSLCVLSKTF